MLSLQPDDTVGMQVRRPLLVCSWGRGAAALLAVIVLLIVAWCVRTDKYMYAVGGVAIVMSALFLALNPFVVESAFSKPRHIGDLTDRQAAYFKTVVITMLSLFCGFACDYVVFQLKASALTWFEVFGIIGGSLSILIKFTRGVGAAVLFCLPRVRDDAPFPIGIPGIAV